ncbi:MAG: hypothetical protein IJR94_06665 [Synergistaceae bacterium]|nr:hypothetical protein [Synergistaceae bacterium]
MTDYEAILLEESQPEDIESQNDYDGLWKDFIQVFWREILKRFLPKLYKDADLNREPEFLDKEFRDLLGDSEFEDEKAPKRFVDNLLRIFLKDGGEEWVLLHIEIQGPGGENFSLRMFRYYCLIFTHHNRAPVALAILTAKRPKKESVPGIYEKNLYGTEVLYKYNVVKAYELSDEELTASDSLVDLFIYALKIEERYKKSEKIKFGYARKVYRLLEKKNFSKQDSRFLFFIQRAIRLKSELYEKLMNEKRIIENGGKIIMREKTPAEKIFEKGKAEGLEEGKAEGKAEGLEEGRAEGLEEGKAEGFLETVKSLISSGLFNDEQIATALHKPLENIKAIRKELEAATV